MKHTIRLAAIVAFIFQCFVFTNSVHAQTNPQQQRAEDLRAQLDALKSRQAELQERLQALGEELKPENIENSLAGVGSTHPEELRDLKRRQLEKEKASVQKQLTLLTENQTRLETKIAQADADAYHESTKTTSREAVTDSTSNQSNGPPPKSRPGKAGKSKNRVRSHKPPRS